ncbi:chromosome partitioning protein [Roseivivax halotolerans]|uniref:Chromosome partitioning protein n=1 Tax=Roseivivax halotolerans TaxID=93684 RepID=A0A1I6AKK9_9RHOB|nr:ParA family protein [Roseivivax halotolerans]SFQ69209.1 chromosome partitioning protein [Roseivivax halotolerans]
MIISFVSSKGGVGKTTSLLVLATELERVGRSKGRRVTIIDADRNAPLVAWADMPGRPENIRVVGVPNTENLVDAIDEEQVNCDVLLLDLPGLADVGLANAIMLSDLVLVPLGGGGLEAAEAAKTIKLVRRQSRLTGREIPYRALMTRAPAGAVEPLSYRRNREQLADQGVPMIKHALLSSPAFQELPDGGNLERMLEDATDKRRRDQVTKAMDNAQAYYRDIIAALKELKNTKTEATE